MDRIKTIKLDNNIIDGWECVVCNKIHTKLLRICDNTYTDIKLNTEKLLKCIKTMDDEKLLTDEEILMYINTRIAKLDNIHSPEYISDESDEELNYERAEYEKTMKIINGKINILFLKELSYYHTHEGCLGNEYYNLFDILNVKHREEIYDEVKLKCKCEVFKKINNNEYI